MPKPPTHALVWVSESASYELWTQGYREISFQASDEAQWLAWLETHLAFSFRGQGGHLNMLKESRQRGRGYWYAYRGQEKRLPRTDSADDAGAAGRGGWQTRTRTGDHRRTHASLSI